MQKRRNNRPTRTYDEIVLDTKAVVKVTKGLKLQKVVVKEDFKQ